MDQIKEQKGIKIFSEGNIKKINSSRFQVHSDTKKDVVYDVQWQKNKWICNCPNFTKNKKRCKHIFAINYFLTIDKIKSGLKNNDKNESICPLCNTDKNVIKRGKSYNRSGPKQRYYCKKCRKKFSGKTNFKKMKHRADVIASSLDLYFRGLSLRQIIQHLEICYKTKVTHATIHYWIKKYVSLINQNINKLIVNSSDRWLADETIINVSGRHMKLWVLLDSESRFILATHISEKRGIEDASKLLKKGANKSKNSPIEVVTDGLASYNEAIKNELKSDLPIIHLQGPLSKGLNNRCERFNKTVKTRTVTMGNLYSQDSMRMFFDGFNIHYNFIKSHSSLNNMTPAQAIGAVKEKYNWLSLINKSNLKDSKTCDD